MVWITTGMRRISMVYTDRKIGRTTRTIHEPMIMKTLFISRVDPTSQFIVLSNPTNQAINLSNYIICNETMSKVFRFPRKYILDDGDEVTIWCTPGKHDFDTCQLLTPYLLWTLPNKSLNSEDFFTSSSNIALLLDNFGVEVAALSIDCLSGKYIFSRCEDRLPWKSPEYIFSRYRNIVSWDFVHFFSIFFVPILESIRALLAVSFFYYINYSSTHSFISLFIWASIDILDWTARNLCLNIDCGNTLINLVAVIIDQLVGFSLYSSLSILFDFSLDVPIFSYLWYLDVFCICVRLLAKYEVQSQELGSRSQLEKSLQNLYYYHPSFMNLCSIGHEVFLFLLFCLAFFPTGSNEVQIRLFSTLQTCLQYIAMALIPLVIFKTIFIFLHGVAAIQTIIGVYFNFKKRINK